MSGCMETIISCLAFPVNLVIALIWVLACHYSWKYAKGTILVRFLLSPAATISSVCAFLLSCIWIGITGDRTFVHTAFFIIVLLYIQTVLLFVLFRGCKNRTGNLRYRFALNHAGLLLALGSAFWGNPDNEQLRLKLEPGQTSQEAYRMDGSRTWLPQEIQLIDLNSIRYEDGTPMQYSADVRIGDEISRIEVNHPYSSGISKDIYLTSVSDGDCILEIVHEPWKYFALVGILMMLAGAFMLFVKGPRS